MSPQKALLHDLARRISTSQTAGLEDLFTADFRLHDPSAPDWPTGAEGARRMVRAFAALGNLRLVVLDAIEEGDRVAVRWDASWTEAGERRRASLVAIYRFVNGRIAEDWGVSARAPWP